MAQMTVRVTLIIPWWITWVYLPLMQVSAAAGLPIDPEACAEFISRHIRTRVV